MALPKLLHAAMSTSSHAGCSGAIDGNGRREKHAASSCYTLQLLKSANWWASVPLSLKIMEEADLQRLIDDGVPEGREIDYKLELAVATDQEKKEFLADVSSFANTVGGALYIGIKEENLLPVELTGLSVVDQDLEIQRLENLLRTGLEPRLPGVNVRPVRLASSRLVIVLEIPQSWALPHRVSLKGHDKFYARNAGGKYPVDVTELRSLFAQSEALTERMRRFRHERLSAIQAGETPIGPGAWPKIVLHLIPIQSFKPGTTLDLSRVQDKLARLRPFQAPGWNYRHNFEGFATFTTDHQEGTTLTYVQVFRTGALEAVDRFMLDYSGDQERHYIPGAYFEQAIASRYSTSSGTLQVGLVRSITLQTDNGKVGDWPLKTSLPLMGPWRQHPGS